jgi:glycosyltransferase involved in cell wall biosynthesis
MFDRAKKALKFAELSELLALQVLAGIDGIRLAPSAVAHFHSWEAGFLAESAEFWRRMSRLKTIFSPYLTTGRLKTVFEARGGIGWTMTPEELAIAAHFERKLSEACTRVVLESSQDCDFFVGWVDRERLDVRSFAGTRTASIARPVCDGRLAFVAGGRPVREKGFVELCRQFAQVRAWAAGRGLEATLSILCRERNRAKGADYIAEMEAAVAASALEEVVTVELKMSMDELRRRIGKASALIVPSLYDPYGLMPTYAIEVNRPSFVSRHAGIAENVKSRDFVFDPEAEGDLVRSVRAWYEGDLTFEFESRFPSYLDLYLSEEPRLAWE